MAPMKSQGSSRRKGKEVASDPPAVPDVGEEAEYSESEHSVGEEAQRDPNNECAPLIDPWYKIHPHFPKVPSDYAPSPPSHVWLALGQRNPNISWAPLASSIPNLAICHGISLPVPIHFEFGSSATSGCRKWVDNELSYTGFMGLLQQAGVLKAIISSSRLSNFRDLYNLRHLVRWWCSTTHTLFFSCDKLTVTLEDVAN